MPVHVPSVQNAVHLERGRSNDVAFVFSCPGRAEYEAVPQGPAKGATGDNLNAFLSIMRERYAGTVMKITVPRKFVRGEIWITNAWDKVIFPGPEEKNSEATDNQVVSTDNLNRLRPELSDIEYAIICCGNKASLAIRQLQAQKGLSSHVGVFHIPHLGNRSLNIAINLGSKAKITPGERRVQRLEAVAEDLNAQAEILSTEIEPWYREEVRRQSRIIANSLQEREDQDFVDAISYRGDE